MLYFLRISTINTVTIYIDIYIDFITFALVSIYIDIALKFFHMLFHLQSHFSSPLFREV